MNENLTELVIVLDKSGSMSSIKADMEGGLKTFLEDQKNVKGECRVTFYKFDYTTQQVFNNVPLENIGEIKLEPNGGTALYDAVAKAINDVGNRLANTQEKDRPGRVIFIIITDGEENSSKEFAGLAGGARIKDMITHQTSKYSWNFNYLGSKHDAWGAAQSLGVTYNNQLTYGASEQGIQSMYDSLGKSIRKSRSLSKVDYDCLVQADSLGFDSSDRAAQKV